MDISKENLQNEFPYAAELQNKNRGELAELAFMRKAASIGFSVAKPWGDCERYDVLVRAQKSLWRVQVKSVCSKSPDRPYYRVRTENWLKVSYSPEDIDFLVAYIFAEDTWYIFPANVVEYRKSLCLTPQSKRSRFEIYREAWHLMGQPRTAPAKPEPLVSGATRTTDP